MYQKPDSPLSIGGVLDDGFKLLKVAFAQVFVLALIASLVSQVPSGLMEDAIVATPTNPFTPVVLAAFLVSSVVGLIMFAAITTRIDAIANGRNRSFGEAFTIALRCILPLLACLILYFLIVFVGMLLLIVPGVILGMSLVFAPYLVITDRAGVIDSFKRSHNLVWGNWWRTAAILTVVLFVMMVAYFLLGLAAGLTAVFGSETDTTGLLILEWVVVPLTGAVITPVIYVFSIAILNDLKLRKEGDDLAARIAAADDGVTR